MADNGLFRQKSIDSISSPEQLNDYIRVTSPGVWMLLLSVVLILIGMVTWGVFGRLETRITVPAVVSDGEVSLYVQADDISRIKIQQDICIGDEYDGYITGIGTESIRAFTVLGDMSLTEAGYDRNEVVYDVDGCINAPDGIYNADIVVDRVSPVTFLVGND